MQLVEFNKLSTNDVATLWPVLLMTSMLYSH